MKKILCIILILAVQSVAFSQASFGLSAGYATNGFGVQASFNHELKNNNYFQVNLVGFGSRSKTINLEASYTTVGLNFGYYQYAYRNRDETFLASVGGGISLAYEIINEGNTILANGAIIQGNSQIIYGGFLGSELQYFLSENLAILGVINTFYYANSDLGSLSGYGGLGVRYYIN